MNHSLRTWRHWRRHTRARVSPWIAISLVLLWFLSIVLGYLLSDVHETGDDGDTTTQESTLLSWDRVYRVNAALETQPAWLRWLLAHEPSEHLQKQAQEELLGLEENKMLDSSGRAILGALILQSDSSLTEKEKERWHNALDPAMARLFSDKPITSEDFLLWQEKLETQDLMPWEIEWLLAAVTDEQRVLLQSKVAAQRAQDQTIMWSYAAASAAFGLAFLWGAANLVRLFRAVIGQRRKRVWPRFSYASRISLSVMVTWMILAEWGNGLLIELCALLGSDWAESWWWQMTIDTLWRILPVVFILAILYRSRAAILSRFGLRQAPAWRWIFACYALLMMIDFGWNGALEWWGVSIESVPLDPMEQGWSGLAYGLISACIMAPVAEEFFYRGFLFRSLQPRVGFWISALVSSLVFALSHYYDLYGTISVAFCGMATAWLYAATRSLVSSIVLHAFYNLSITIPSWLLFYAPW